MRRGVAGTRSSRATATAPRRRASCTASRSAHARHPARLHAGGGRETVEWRARVPRPRRRRRRARRARGGVPARAVRGGRSRSRETPGSAPSRTRARSRGLRRCAARSRPRRRPDPARHPRRRGPGLLAEIAARGIVLDVCPLSNLRTGAVASLARAPAAAARRRRRPLLDLDRRPGDVRHRPHARLRGGDARSASTRSSSTRRASPARSATTRRASGSADRRLVRLARALEPLDSPHGHCERSGAGRLAQ